MHSYDGSWSTAKPVTVSAGPAADAQGQSKAIEQLAAEVEASSSIALRSVWRWTCFQVCMRACCEAIQCIVQLAVDAQPVALHGNDCIDQSLAGQ